MRCPILTARDYKMGFENNLIFNGFRGQGINWDIEENRSKLSVVGFNDEQEVEFIGTDKEWNRDDIKTCKLCGTDFQMVHNEDEYNLSQIESIEETGRCGECYEEWGDNYPDR